MMDEKLKEMVRTDTDSIALKRYDFSLLVLRAKYKDDVIPNKLVAAALMLTEDELEEEYERIVRKLQQMMVPELP